MRVSCCILGASMWIVCNANILKLCVVLMAYVYICALPKFGADGVNMLTPRAAFLLISYVWHWPC
jgi:hypothetical protein